MYTLSNETFSILADERGILDKFHNIHDEHNMNWVIDKDYLEEHGYPDNDKLFGDFELIINNRSYTNKVVSPTVQVKRKSITFMYDFLDFRLFLSYHTEKDKALQFKIVLENAKKQNLTINKFAIWTSLAYLMFRDTNVIRNMRHSCAVFPHVSDHFTKLIAKKRDNNGPDLAMYCTNGSVKNVATFCRYTNRFREQVSPSLDGALFHQLLLINDSFRNGDWIYDQIQPNGTLEAGLSKEWTFEFMEHSADMDSYQVHPVIDYSPIVIENHDFQALIGLPENMEMEDILLVTENEKKSVFPFLEQQSDNRYLVRFPVKELGEKKLEVVFTNKRTDFIVFNVMPPINELINYRAEHLITESLIDDSNKMDAFGFEPISNQGESLGKLCFLLKKNLLSEMNQDEVRKVEKSAVYYMKGKWFINGDFQKPRDIHGDFYRIIDFDYVAHVFYLLSCYDNNTLLLNDRKTYLQWAAKVMTFRFDETKHSKKREKEETKMNGIFNLFIKDLLKDLKESLPDLYQPLQNLWDKFCLNIINQKDKFAAAITEHYYDNAGFGPTAESLSLYGDVESAKTYGELVLANIGVSNDFRNQNPDRWWEALSYMIHSLWGGLVSHSALVVFEQTGDTRYLHAAYNSMMAVLYCYDWNAMATKDRLSKGEAASTYSVAYPNLNKLKLSHNRFGQSVFMEDDPELFAGNATGDDWDMGEELVAYLDGFGTTTYVYCENDKLICVNGELKEDNGVYTITSFAAYPKMIKFYHMDLEHIVINNNSNSHCLKQVSIKKSNKKWQQVGHETFEF
ncbi:hypothetical protein GI584_19460 [Gracilibacillus salitolerans]|uniref:Uncharacterized protein n=1 Tax=Gracilibacillus salitolerans TaxID=2663022 RepID=A0A5Q2TPK7_9BACI|nr:hypothetical protein [Gracilibacillus salitolerans]QGH36091.1 hypothetical protein GI584_19460 [Gracilibacillus salitolerans]